MVAESGRDGIADERQVPLGRVRENKLVGKRLQARALAHGQTAVKVMVKLDAPARVGTDAVRHFPGDVFMVALPAPGRRFR